MAASHGNQMAGVEVSTVLQRKGAFSRINGVWDSRQKKKNSDCSLHLFSSPTEVGYWKLLPSSWLFANCFFFLSYTCSVHLPHCCHNGHSKVRIWSCHLPTNHPRLLKAHKVSHGLASAYSLCFSSFFPAHCSLHTAQLLLISVACWLLLYLECLSHLFSQPLSFRIQPMLCLF